MQKQLIHKIIKIIINDNPNFVFDSRIVKKGDIFIGIKTNNDNGSNYVDAALKKGCSLAIIDKKILHKNILYSPNVIKLLKSISIEIYNFAHEFALSKDILIADTKMEFGLIDKVVEKRS